MSRGKKKIVCVDFDGVVHQYSAPFRGATVIPDPPVAGAFAWLAAASARFEVCIYSSRSKEPGGIAAMRAWFTSHGMSAAQLATLGFPTQKPAAFMTIDDRAIRFDGRWPALETIDGFVPWNKRARPTAWQISDEGGRVRLELDPQTSLLELRPREARALARRLLEAAEKLGATDD